MPVCCRCNGSGRCKSCACVKAGRPCTDFLPSRNGHCRNAASSQAPLTPPFMSTADNGHGLSLALTGDIPGSVANGYSHDTPCSTNPGRGVNANAMFDNVNTDTPMQTRILPSFRTVPSIYRLGGTYQGRNSRKRLMRCMLR
jgi:hypothetical protein